MLDAAIIEAVAIELGTTPGLVEKDWHVVRALSVLASLNHGIAQPAFSGGTALSKGWQLINRFSEDIDFKIKMPAKATRAQRSDYRKIIISELQNAEFILSTDPIIGNDSKFFSAEFSYPSHFTSSPGLRPHLRVEMTFDAPSLSPIYRSLQSLVSKLQDKTPEILKFPCVNPVETAADKLSALAWRACTRVRNSDNDDPTIVRHLHDLAALETIALDSSDFFPLLKQKAVADSGRGGGKAPEDPAERFSTMLHTVNNDPLWSEEYETFVAQVSFAAPANTITFSSALNATTRLVTAYIQHAR